jgi:hypothetical protein
VVAQEDQEGDEARRSQEVDGHREVEGEATSLRDHLATSAPAFTPPTNQPHPSSSASTSTSDVNTDRPDLPEADPEDDDRICRICFCPAPSSPEEQEEMGRLISPCLCSGTMSVSFELAWRCLGGGYGRDADSLLFGRLSVPTVME